jgi:hypothetical protein
MIVRQLGAAVVAAVLVAIAPAQTSDHTPSAHPTAPHATGKPQGGDDKDKSSDPELAARRAEAKEFREKMHAFMDKHPHLREELFEQKAEHGERADDKAMAEEFAQFEAMIHARGELMKKRAMAHHEERADNRQDRREDRVDDRQDHRDGDRPRAGGTARPRAKN